MSLNITVFTILFILTMHWSPVIPAIVSKKQALYNHVFLSDINTALPPVIKEDAKINVTLDIEFIQIVAVDESTQEVTVKLWRRMTWKNELLQWNSTEWGGITKMKVWPDKVWKPDIMLYQSIIDDNENVNEKHKELIYLYSNGQNYWGTPRMVKISCHMDVENFPFDSQTCDFMFGSWAHDYSEMNLRIGSSPYQTDSYVRSAEWTIKNVKAKRNLVYYKVHGIYWADVTVSLTILRKPLYYICNVILPCIILMTVIQTSWFMPPESGERIAIIITVMLAFTVFMYVLSEWLPPNSDNSPALSIFYVSIMSETAFALAATCIVLLVHHRTCEVPQWVKKYFLGKHTRFLGLGVFIEEKTASEEYIATNVDVGLQPIEKPAEDVNQLEEKRINMAESQSNSSEVPAIDERGTTFMDLVNMDKGRVDLIITQMKVITDNIRDQCKQDQITAQWKFVARVLDRLLFIFFSILYITTSLATSVPVYYRSII